MESLQEKYPIGYTGHMPIGLISPSQPDDGSPSRSNGKAASVYKFGGGYIIEHGNHRYYDAVIDGSRTLYVTVVEDPSY